MKKEASALLTFSLERMCTSFSKNRKSVLKVYISVTGLTAGNISVATLFSSPREGQVCLVLFRTLHRTNINDLVKLIISLRFIFVESFYFN